jgi:hypothetical protein
LNAAYMWNSNGLKTLNLQLHWGWFQLTRLNTKSWRLLSSGMWHHVFWQTCTHVLEKPCFIYFQSRKKKDAVPLKHWYMHTKPKALSQTVTGIRTLYLKHKNHIHRPFDIITLHYTKGYLKASIIQGAAVLFYSLYISLLNDTSSNA